MITELQERLAAKSAELLQLSEKHGKPNDVFSQAKSQSAAGATLLDDLKSVARACERPAKHAKMTQVCKGFSTTSSAAVFLALLKERDDLKSRCEALALESQCKPD